MQRRRSGIGYVCIRRDACERGKRRWKIRKSVLCVLGSDEQAIVETRDKYGGYCHNIAWNILKERMDTEECLNDTWLRAWNTMPTTWPAALMAYLGKITRNLAISLYRGRNAEKRGGGTLAVALDELGDCVSGGENVEHEVESRETAQQISRFLRSLPQTQCDLFVRRYWYLDSI